MIFFLIFFVFFDWLPYQTRHVNIYLILEKKKTSKSQNILNCILLSSNFLFHLIKKIFSLLTKRKKISKSLYLTKPEPGKKMLFDYQNSCLYTFDWLLYKTTSTWSFQNTMKEACWFLQTNISSGWNTKIFCLLSFKTKKRQKILKFEKLELENVSLWVSSQLPQLVDQSISDFSGSSFVK